MSEMKTDKTLKPKADIAHGERVVNMRELMKEYRNYVMTSFGMPFPIVIAEAQDVYLTDVEGKRYLDFWAGIAVVSIGHNNPATQNAVKMQLDRLVHCASESYFTLPALELAKKLTSIAPFEASKASFHTSGSEAVDLAMKMARRHTGKHEFLSLQGSYHGQTYGSRSLGTPVASYSKDFTMGPWLPGVVHVPAPYCYRCSLGLEYPGCGLQCAKMIEDTINFSTSRDVAAFIAEPILGVGGIVTPPDDYFREVKRVLDEHDILLILDEVQTGFGRTGTMWGAETYGVQPDIITLAKALGNGWPISAVVASNEICASLEGGDHFSTWGSNPVMCAAANATIDYIVENRMWENAARMGGQLMKRLKGLEEDYDIIGEVRGKGLMLGVEIVKDKASREPSVELGKRVRGLCADNGLIVGIGGFWSNVIRIQPPLTISGENIDEAMSILEKALKDVDEEAR